MFDNIDVSTARSSRELQETIQGLKVHYPAPHQEGPGVEMSERDRVQYARIFETLTTKIAEAEANLSIVVDRENGVLRASDLVALD